MFDSKRTYCLQAEEEDKADKMERKKHKKMENTETKGKAKGKGRGRGMRRPAAASETAASQTNASSGKRALDVTPMAIPDPAKSPKKRQRKSKSVAKQDVAEPGVEEQTDKALKGKDAKEFEKAQRRVKAKEGWEKLQKARVPGLEMPQDLNGRISFTVKSPDGQGSSVGVILNTDSFYISKAVKPDLWPTTCTHLKVGSSTSRGIAFHFLPNTFNIFQLNQICLA